MADRLVGPRRSDGNSYIFHNACAQNTPLLQQGVDKLLDDSRKTNNSRAQGDLRKIAGTYLKEGSIIYLYNRLVSRAHGEARGLYAAAGWPGARGGVKLNLSKRTLD